MGEDSMMKFCQETVTYKESIAMSRQTEFEKQRELYENLMDQIYDGMDRARLAADRAKAASIVLCKSSDSAHLEKAANLLQTANEEIARVEGLQRQAKRAVERAEAARADHEARALLCQPAPLPRGTFASRISDETEVEKTLSAGVLSRRFSR
jgi:hypothetical protein